MKIRNKILQWVSYIRRQETLISALYIIIFLIIASFLTLIPQQAAPVEIATAESSQSISQIARNPLNAPYKISALVMTEISSSVRAVRFVSTIFLGVCLIAMYYTLRHWHSIHASALTTLAFGLNAVVLAIGRLGTPLITLMSWYVVTAFLLWLMHTRSNRFIPAISIAIIGVTLYIPGAIWFYLTSSIVLRKRVRKLFSHVKRQAVLLGVLALLAIISPLIISFSRNYGTFQDWLLLPDVFRPTELWRDILRVPSAFLYRMPVEPLINVARLPIFDLASGFLFLIGLNAYRKKMSLDRTKIMLSIVLTAVIVGTFGQLIAAIVILLPFAYSVIAAGIEFILDEWYTVFPRNPLAKSFAVVMVTLTILLSVFYQTTRFLVVWPQTPETRSTYSESRKLQ